MGKIVDLQEYKEAKKTARSPEEFKEAILRIKYSLECLNYLMREQEKQDEQRHERNQRD